MRIRQVRIRNFKSFGELDLSLRASNCLVGPNNSGKTTLLQALALFDFCKQCCLSRRNGVYELKNRSVAPEDFHVLQVAKPADLWTDRKTSENRTHKAIEIALSFESGLVVSASVKLDFNRFELGVETSDESQEALARLRDFSIVYLPVSSPFLPREERRTRIAVEDEVDRGRVNVVVRNLLVNLKEAGKDGRLAAALRRLFPEVEELDIVFDEASDRFISVEYRERDRPKALDLFSAGGGFQQFLYLFGSILLREPDVVLLDEPDQSLHGTLQRALVGELDRLVEKGTQVLFATHSRDLIERTDPRDVIFLDGGEARPLSIAFDVYDTLDALGSVDATKLPALERYRRVLIVENKTDYELLDVFCRRCLGVETWRFVERRIGVCYAEGNPCRQDMARLRRQLAQTVQLTGQTLEAFVVADRDYYPDPDELKRSLPHEHLSWHVWERTEIENYLLVVDALIRLLGGGQGQQCFWEGDIRQAFDRLIEESRDEAFDRLLKSHQEQSRRLGKNWDMTTLSRKSRTFLEQNWTADRAGLADAKDIVLPGIKRWCQEQGLESFSNRRLAESLRAPELPGEVHDLARRLADFAGVKVPEK